MMRIEECFRKYDSIRRQAKFYYAQTNLVLDMI